MYLTSSEKSLIESALGVAAEKYKENAAILRSTDNGATPFPNLAALFDTQAVDAGRLQSKFIDADSVLLAPYAEDKNARS